MRVGPLFQMLSYVDQAPVRIGTSASGADRPIVIPTPVTVLAARGLLLHDRKVRRRLSRSRSEQRSLMRRSSSGYMPRPANGKAGHER